MTELMPCSITPVAEYNSIALRAMTSLAMHTVDIRLLRLAKHALVSSRTYSL